MLSVSMVVTVLLAVYGYNCYFLLRASRKYRSPELAILTDSRPEVAVHLPIYNEKYVLPRLLRSCVEMADTYDKRRVRIVLLDDSDDETAEEMDCLVKGFREEGFRVEVERRTCRDGFKAGALQGALEKTSEDFIAVFDADFIPPRDFLLRTVPYLLNDEKLGVVQCRWGHINRDYNFITRAIAIGIDAHFLIEQPGRYAAGCFLNFNGSGGVLRRKALEDAGGWQSDTLAEDLDASYRMQLKGYQILYLRGVESLGEIPPTVPSFKKQQGRWACGSIQTAKKVLPTLLRDRSYGLTKRFQALLHLTYYAVHPLMLGAFLLVLAAAFLNLDAISVGVMTWNALIGQTAPTTLEAAIIMIAKILVPAVLVAAIGIGALATWIFAGAAIRMEGLSLSQNMPSLFVLFLLGYGVSLNNTFEAGKAFFSRGEKLFRRTPKYAVESKKDDWVGKRYQVSLDKVALLEIVATAAGVLALLVATLNLNFGLVPYLALFTSAYGLVSFLTLIQSRKEM